MVYGFINYHTISLDIIKIGCNFGCKFKLMIQIKRNLIFSLEKRKKEGNLITDNVPIRLRVNFEGSRVDIQTGYRIDISKWNEDKEEVKNGSFNKLGQSSSSINSRLLELKVAIQDLFGEYERLERIPTKEEIKQVAKSLKSKGKVKPKVQMTNSLMDVFDEFVKENGRLNNWSTATFTKFSAVQKHINNFNAELTFDDLDESGLTDYLIHLRKVGKMKNSTIKKTTRVFKVVSQMEFRKALSFK